MFFSRFLNVGFKCLHSEITDDFPEPFLFEFTRFWVNVVKMRGVVKSRLVEGFMAEKSSVFADLEVLCDFLMTFECVNVRVDKSSAYEM